MNLRTVSGKMLIHGIVNDLIDQMIETAARNTSYIHAGPHPDCLEPLQNRYIFCTVIVSRRHPNTS